MPNQNPKKTGLFIILGIVILIIAAAAYAFYVYSEKHPVPGIPPPGSGVTGNLIPPKIPTTGAYLGARVNPENVTGASNDVPGSKEIAQLATFNAAIGRPLAFLPVFIPFTDPIPQEALTPIDQNGSIPLIDLGCANVEEINSGKDDAAITAEANAMKTFGKPAFMRWYWEMNKNDISHTGRSCDAYNNGPAFIAAWQHIWKIFHDVGATNVAFVWCPSAGSVSTAQYYPGDAYVDWIAGDGFDREKRNATNFDGIFGSFYTEWVGHNKPIMIGATGALPVDQVAYLQEIQQKLPQKYPQIKAINYFDSGGNNGDWTLQGPGLAAFKTLANTPYFTFR
ncbi:hypothetical protein H0X32_02190 [Patescibacteria group bacterium]|nr:hypothetical protein [Patescibacteria group bacterium]